MYYHISSIYIPITPNLLLISGAFIRIEFIAEKP